MTAGAATVLHSNLIVTLAGRHTLPAVYNERSFAAAGGIPKNKCFFYSPRRAQHHASTKVLEPDLLVGRLGRVTFEVSTLFEFLNLIQPR